MVKTAIRISALSLLLIFLVGCGMGMEAYHEQSASSTASSGHQASGGFQCDPNVDPSASNFYRLTKREFVNTLNDLVGAVLVAQIQGELDTLPNDGEQLGFDSVSQVVTGTFIESYSRIADALADKIVTNGDALTAIAGACAARTATLNEACALQFIKSFGLRAHRRPLSSADVTAYLELFRAAGETRKLIGIQMVLMGMLQSPHFIYRIENSGVAVQGRPNVFNLDGFELASRLSYLVWGSMPDAELFAAASDGRLTTDAGIATQTRRLSSNTKAHAHFRSFYGQWLQLDKTPNAPANANLLAGISQTDLKKEAIQELEDYVDHHMWDSEGTFEDLMTSDLVFPKGQNIAKVYGLANPSPVGVRLPGERKGLITRAALMMNDTSYTRPIMRSVRVKKKFLCQTLPQPNLNAAQGDLLAPVEPSLTTGTREATTIRTGQASCMSCHSQINPIGFALEGFDPLGRRRDVERVFNAQGSLIGTARVDTLVEAYIGGKTARLNGADDLADEIASANESKACLTTQIVRFSLGRAETVGDGCMMNAVYDVLKNSKKPMREMLVEMSLHPHFKMRNVK